MQNLVLVAGHAVLLHPHRLGYEDAWHLLDFQKGEPPKYLGHIQTAIAACAADPESVLIFSGGPTRREAGPRSEALSYWLAAEHSAWFGHPHVRERAYLEDFARDSFENLLFGICRFQEVTGREPQHVTLVSWEFKRRRFEELHRQAIGWPRDRFSYLGPNNPDALDQALASEARALEKYTADPLSQSPEFRAKKAERNPFQRFNGYIRTNPRWAHLLCD